MPIFLSCKESHWFHQPFHYAIGHLSFYCLFKKGILIQDILQDFIRYCPIADTWGNWNIHLFMKVCFTFIGRISRVDLKETKKRSLTITEEFTTVGRNTIISQPPLMIGLLNNGHFIIVYDSYFKIMAFTAGRRAIEMQGDVTVKDMHHFFHLETALENRKGTKPWGNMYT